MTGSTTKRRWVSGETSSCPSDGGAFLKKDGWGWWVFLTNGMGEPLKVDGRMPPIKGPFDQADEAQRWADANLPLRNGDTEEAEKIAKASAAKFL